MKKITIAASALAILLVAGLATVAIANSGHQNEASENEHGEHHGFHLACSNLTLNEVLTVTVPHGHYINVTDPSKHGNASGTFDLKVTSIYVTGCTLSITGGSFKLNMTTYTVTGGTIVLNHGGRSGEGTGTTSGGTFLIRIAGLQDPPTSADVGGIRLDFKNGSSEFLVQLSSPEAED